MLLFTIAYMTGYIVITCVCVCMCARAYTQVKALIFVVIGIN